MVRRGNHVVIAAGAGAGTLVAFGAPLIDGLVERGEEGDPSQGPGATSPQPSVIVLTPTDESARLQARSLSRVGGPVGVRVTALRSGWSRPEAGDIVFGSPSDILNAVEEGRMSLDGADALVIDRLDVLVATHGVEGLEVLLTFAPSGCQRVILTSPRDGSVEVAELIRSFVAKHLDKAVTVPPRPASGELPESPRRGQLTFLVTDTAEDEFGLSLIGRLLDPGDVHHVTVFVRTDDRVADVSDFLSMHGYHCGPPGESSSPVWVTTDDAEGRASMDAVEVPTSVVSWDVPADADSLDRRHGAGRQGTVIVRSRELPHLRDCATRAGYKLTPGEGPSRSGGPRGLTATLSEVEGALEEQDVPAYTALLEPLFAKYDATEVAAALFALLRQRARSDGASTGAVAEDTSSRLKPGSAGQAWVRLFLSLGHRDGAGPGDIVGAISGEAGVPGSKVGRIDLRDTFAIVEIEEAFAEKVVKGLNGKTVRGRAVRVDYDRDRSGRGERPKRPDSSRRAEGRS